MNYSYDRRASEGGDWVLGNAMDAQLKKRIQTFLKTVSTQGQALTNDLDRAVKEAKKTVQDGDKITQRDVHEAVMRIVEPHFGRDHLAKALAKAIVTGDGFF